MKLLFILLSVDSFLLHHGASSADPVKVSVSVMKTDPVTLYSCAQKTQQEDINWYFNDIRIAQITGVQSKTCTDVQCKERFRGRLKLDNQTGSLTITNTDSGEYKLQISTSSSSDREKIFSVSVHGVTAEQVKKKSVKEGDSVTLDLKRNPNDVMMLHFNGIRIAKITGYKIEIYTDVQCEERFGDRLKVDNQTGYLNIIDTRNTDSGEYKLLINSGSSSSRRRRSSSSSISNNIEIFNVTVTGQSSSVPGSGVSAGGDAGIVFGVLVFAAVAAAVV